MRKNESGEDLVRHRHSIKLDNRFSRNMRLEMETGIEIWHYTGQTNNVDYQRFFVNGGYRWNL